MMEETEMKRPALARVATVDAPNRPPAPAGSTAERRARLVVACACDILGIDPATLAGEIRLPLSVEEFEQQLRQRYALTYPELVFRTDSTLERARLERRGDSLGRSDHELIPGAGPRDQRMVQHGDPRRSAATL